MPECNSRYWDPDSTIADIGAYYFDQILGVEPPEISSIPTSYNLSPPYPNPFNNSVTISFAVPLPGKVDLKVFDVLGREAGANVHLPLQEWYPAGYHSVVWDADDCASGMYFLRMQAGDYVQVRKVIMLK